MLRMRNLILIVLALVLLSGCRFSRRDNTRGVYATAYLLLTQTASTLPGGAPPPAITPVQTQATPLPTITGSPVSTGQPAAPGPQAGGDTAAMTPASGADTLVPGTTAQLTQLPSQNPLVQTSVTPGATATQAATPTSGFTPLPGAPVDGLVGVWQQDHSGWFAQFSSDGAYRLARSFTSLEDDIWDTGSYQLQSGQATMDSSTNSPNCRSLRGVYQFHIPGEGQRRLNPAVSEACFEREDLMQRGDWLWTSLAPGAQPASEDAWETAVQLIPLSGPAARPDARLVGLSWVDEYLLLLPQVPSFASSSGDGQLFTLRKPDIAAYLSGTSRTMPAPVSLELIAGGLLQQIPGFQGFQGMAPSGDRIILLALGSSAGVTRSYLLSGTADLVAGRLTLDPAKLVEIPAQPTNPQLIYRSLLVKDGVLILLPETQAAAANPAPVAQLFDANLSYTGSMSLPAVEYFITDATIPDTSGKFWVINRYAPGDPLSVPSLDPLALRYGEGLTHQLVNWVERLLLVSSSPTGIILVEEPPLQLELWVKAGRNWQAITRLDDRGLLVATSQSPETLLGFVDFP